ncbi:zinc finger protein 24 [Lates japonicus]
MAAEDTFDYKQVKETILAKYEINKEVYQQRFREHDICPNESPRKFYNQLKDLNNEWIQPEKRTKNQVGEILILEQFYRSFSPELDSVLDSGRGGDCRDNEEGQVKALICQNLQHLFFPSVTQESAVCGVSH